MQELPKEFIDKYIKNIEKLNPEQLEQFLETLDQNLKNIICPSA